VGITADSREVPGRNACDRRHTYCIIIIIIIIIIIVLGKQVVTMLFEATGANIVVDIVISDVQLGTVITKV